jgi:hypothetical protein
MNKKLFNYQEGEAGKKNSEGQDTMVVFPVSMKQGIGTNAQGQDDHAGLKKRIMDDIGAKKGQAGKEKGQQSTMYGTCKRSTNTQSIPIDPEFHKRGQK